MKNNELNKPTLHTVLSPALLHLYDLREKVVVIIDILRATSTIATALHNGARAVIPVMDVHECIALAQQIEAISAGERDGKIAEGLSYGNSPFTFPKEFVEGKKVVLTTTNGTRLLHNALAADAGEIITGSFCNFTSTCNYLKDSGKGVVLACAAWKDKVNLEDTLFAGAVIHEIGHHFQINCDASMMAESLYTLGQDDLFEFMKERNASHYHRLIGFGHERDLRYCLQKDLADTLPVYRDGRLVANS